MGWEWNDSLCYRLQTFFAKKHEIKITHAKNAPLVIVGLCSTAIDRARH
jgi:hypothetical protein